MEGLLLPATPYDRSSFSIHPHNLVSTTSGLDGETQSFRTTQASQVIDETLLQPENLTRPPNDDRTTTSETFGATMKSVVSSMDQTVSGIPNLETHLEFLWQSFVGQIAPFLTPFGSCQDNPFLKYLVPQAETDPALLTAVLYLAQIITTRDRKDPLGPGDCFLEDEAKVILGKVQQHEPLKATDGETIDPTAQTRIAFSTALVLCMAFLASQNAPSLVLAAELAIVLCQKLFKELADDESFLYLVNLLGFILNAMKFSAHTDTINAPDYLSAALEFHDRHADTLREIDGYSARPDHFRDLDMFSGMSAAMASIMYTLGTLVKRKKAGLQGTYTSHAECLRTFESDVDGLETRLRRHLAVINKRPDPQSTSTASQQPPEVSLTRCLNSFNEALFWSAWTIFWADLRNPPTDKQPNTSDSAERILDACAEIPTGSITAPLILFPLVVGGTRTTKKVYREFVLGRLQGLRNVGLTDTQRLCNDLKNWWSSGRSASEPTALFSVVF
ncbi:hypothetical protein FDECE_13832 [Fusarium decemcellulare]|nr:hypothetical protein FDECE_13832 [Fusarium decemcellulare]